MSNFIYFQMTRIFHSSKNLYTQENEVNGALKNIPDWLISNNLTPNVEKI